MKKVLAVFLAIMMVVALAACGSSGRSSSSTSMSAVASVSVASTPESSGSTQEQQSDSSGADTQMNTKSELNNIQLSYKVDSALSQVIVTAENASKYNFTGDINVEFRNSSNKIVGYDMLIVEELTPGNSTYGRINVSETENLTFKYNFSKGCVFEEAAASSGGTINDKATSTLNDNMKGSFGGGNGGTPTSWYGYIVKLEVFIEDNQNYAVATVNTSDNESIKRIGNTIYANYSKDLFLVNVLVKDESGNTLFQRAQ